jgi:CPA2 family monovalent cation:H+ antiporter-2/glutathione-regulated potassium-efflux system protein KefB
LALGLLLSQGGEFGFVLFTQAQNAMLIEPKAASLFGAIVTLSMATTPFLMRYTRRFRAEPEVVAEGLLTPQADGASAIVIGYGRFGQTVAQMLIGQQISVTLIDLDTEMIAVAGTFGAKVYYGDGTRVDLLRQAGAADAQLLLFCLDGDQLDTANLTTIHEMFPQATIFARAYDRRSVIKMRGAPIEGVVREVFESAITMARRAMLSVGVDEVEITKTENGYRKNDLARLYVQKESGDIYAGRDILERVFSGAAADDIEAEAG